MVGEQGEEAEPLTPKTQATRDYLARLLNKHTENITKVVNKTREALNSTNTIITVLHSRIVQLEQAQLSSATTSRATAAIDDYAADTELDNVVNTNSDHAHRRHHRRREVRDHDDPLLKIKFLIPHFAGKYDPDAYLTWEMAIEQKFECYDIPDNKRIRAATSEFTDFGSIWWQEYCRTNRDVATTWEGMERVMRARFVPSYYSHDLLNKLQCLKQGKNTVEEYYQELQIGMLLCG